MSVWVWLIVAALLILLEAVTFDFILGWFAVGSIFACIMAIISDETDIPLDELQFRRIQAL